MPAPKRIHEPGHRHFVTFGTYKRRAYLAPDRTRDMVVEVLQKALTTHNTFCAGFVIMPDHVHAILFGDEKFNVSQFVQVWKKTTSYRIRQFYEKEFSNYQMACLERGPIWQAGFYDFNIDSNIKNNQKLDYMHHNPVEAKLADVHVFWNWSSAKFYELGESVGATITH
jgi:putative transposase